MRYKCNKIKLRFKDNGKQVDTMEGDYEVKFADNALVITSYRFDAQRNMNETDRVLFFSFPDDVVAFVLS